MRKKKSKRTSSLKVTTARERMEKLDTAGSSSYLKLPQDTRFFEPQKGKNIIDILGYEVGAGNPVADEGSLYYERTFWIHRNIGVNGDRVICSAKTFGRKCAVCEERDRLRRDGDGDAQSEQLVLELAPKERQVFNVFDAKKADNGVTIWEISAHLFGKKLDEEIDGAEEEDAWELFHTYGEDGKTLRVNMVEDSFGGNTFLRAGSIHFVDRRTELDEEEMLEQAINLDEILVDHGYDKVKAMIDATSDDDDDDAPKRKRGTKPKKSAPVDDDDDEEEDDLPYDDEEEDEPAPKKRATKPKKKAPPVDDDDDDDDDDFDDDEEIDPDDLEDDDIDDDEEEDEPPPKKKKAAKKPAAKKKAPVDDDDEDDWDDFDEDDSDEEEEPAPKKKAKPAAKKTVKKKAPVDDDDDDDWDDDEEEDEPAPYTKPAAKKKRR